MKKLIVCTFTMLFFNKTQAQNYTSFKVDTINIHGYVYDHKGKPADAVIYSRGRTYPEDARTNQNGEFFIKGAQLIDTFGVYSKFTQMAVINKGSRFLIITLPPGRNYEMTNNFEISGKRKKPKQPAAEIRNEQTVMFDNHFFEKLAYFKNGYIGLQTYLKSKITYPQQAIDNNIEGEVQIGFLVDGYGFTKDFKILRGLGYGCDEQVIKALQNCPQWTPAIIFGKRAAMPSSITINFKLTDK